MFPEWAAYLDAYLDALRSSPLITDRNAKVVIELQYTGDTLETLRARPLFRVTASPRLSVSLSDAGDPAKISLELEREWFAFRDARPHVWVYAEWLKAAAAVVDTRAMSGDEFTNRMRAKREAAKAIEGSKVAANTKAPGETRST